MTNVLKGKKIVLGITGSIAAYKACYIIRGLIKKGAEVQVVITPAGKEFITPITLSALTSKPVISEFFSQRDGTWHSHVDLGLWADAMLIAPATASTIGKMANGVADNMLVTTYLSAKAPVFVAPAMDLDMYAHPSTQKNLDTLRAYGNHIIEPASGELASHLVGKGRMEEPENIIRQLEEYFAAKEGDLVGKTILITTGPTYEKMDQCVSSAIILRARWALPWPMNVLREVPRSFWCRDLCNVRRIIPCIAVVMWSRPSKCMRPLPPLSLSAMRPSCRLPWPITRPSRWPMRKSSARRREP